MLGGELYWAGDGELVAERLRCQGLVLAFNAEPDERRRSTLLREMLGEVGDRVTVAPPLFCDYGYNVSLGADVFLNYNTVILDCAPVVIGPHAQVGPAVQIVAADHPRDPDLRVRQLESAAPVEIGANTWIGGGAIVCPGVTIGRDTVIGAGSVVTRDIPAGVVAMGSPCRVTRSL